MPIFVCHHIINDFLSLVAYLKYIFRHRHNLRNVPFLCSFFVVGWNVVTCGHKNGNQNVFSYFTGEMLSSSSAVVISIQCTLHDTKDSNLWIMNFHIYINAQNIIFKRILLSKGKEKMQQKRMANGKKKCEKTNEEHEIYSYYSMLSLKTNKAILCSIAFTNDILSIDWMRLFHWNLFMHV